MLSRATARPGLATLLDREVGRLDQLLGDVRLGVRDQRHFDELEERAQGIAQRLTAAFRSRPVGRGGR